MTNELEKQFFDTFGIEASGKKCTCDVRDFAKCNTYYCTSCEKALEKEYPQITDRILLELIIILGTICTVFDKNVDDLKENVLKNLIELSGRYHIYNQVRTLFEES